MEYKYKESVTHYIPEKDIKDLTVQFLSNYLNSKLHKHFSAIYPKFDFYIQNHDLYLSQKSIYQDPYTDTFIDYKKIPVPSHLESFFKVIKELENSDDKT